MKKVQIVMACPYCHNNEWEVVSDCVDYRCTKCGEELYIGLMNYEDVPIRDKGTNNKFGLTSERYQQMMDYYKGDEGAVRNIVLNWGADACNKGYTETDYFLRGAVCVIRIDEVMAFENDEEAALAAEKDGYKFIPVDELPENFEDKLRIWIDTPWYRKRIAEWCEGRVDTKVIHPEERE